MNGKSTNGKSTNRVLRQWEDYIKLAREQEKKSGLSAGSLAVLFQDKPKKKDTP